MFRHLKINRAIATRYDQLADSFLGMLYIATARTGSNLSTPPSWTYRFYLPFRIWELGADDRAPVSYFFGLPKVIVGQSHKRSLFLRIRRCSRLSGEIARHHQEFIDGCHTVSAFFSL